MRKLLMSVLCIASSTIAYAAESKLDCKDPQSNYEMKMCAARELKQAEGELKVAFKRALKAAEEQYATGRSTPGLENMPNMPRALRKAQRAWEVFRDANCSYQDLVYYGGTMAPLAVTSCLRDMTKTRVKELNELVDPG